eukprot:TRINITY_DN6312_c0_g1_i3.p1 TRINITY_DN6312_c0_g1~~TRINITY_DN6312_c0_g1_i3.p1  ORF type:complete len:134 (+),score=43.69 TRINITY_DN6312_c0_g1_i3:121-522(+)
MLRSLVGSEMCIRDSQRRVRGGLQVVMGKLHDLVFNNSIKQAIHNPDSSIRKALRIKSPVGRFAVNCLYFSGTMVVGYCVMQATTRSPEDLGLTVGGKPSSAHNRETAAMAMRMKKQLQPELDRVRAMKGQDS